MRAPFIEACKTRYLLADGGVSVALRRMCGGSENVAERLNLTDPDLVLQMHEAYVEAGADCLTTNSFAANVVRQAPADSATCEAMCEAAARLARQAAGTDRYVLGSVGPWWHIGDGWEDAVGKQVRELADGGVDAIWIETVVSVEMARDLVKLAQAHDSRLPVLVSFVFQKTRSGEFRLPGEPGESLDDVGRSLESIGADGYGVNCGIGLDVYDYADLVSKLREFTAAPIIARPSAGDPTEDESSLPVYPDSPEFMAEGVWGIVRAGANVIGGCCGVTPEHTRAFRAELDML